MAAQPRRWHYALVAVEVTGTQVPGLAPGDCALLELPYAINLLRAGQVRLTDYPSAAELTKSAQAWAGYLEREDRERQEYLRAKRREAERRAAAAERGPSLLDKLRGDGHAQ